MANLVQRRICRSSLGLPRVSLVLFFLANCLGWAATNLWAADQETVKQTPPNIIFILADDLGYSDVGFHGSEIQTPHLDRLAAAGAKLESFYVMPVCTPTRASLMTGRYPMRYGLQSGVIRPWSNYGLSLEERLLPAALREAGYATAVSGKWHLGQHEPAYLPTNRGFDQQYGHYCGAIDYFRHDRDGGHDWHRNDQVNRDEGYATTLIGQEAVRVIQQHDTAKPLFLYVPFNAPHAPLQALPEHVEIYKDIPNPKRRNYAAMVHAMDEQIGQIAAAIAERDLTQKTLIVFSSDNGGPTKNGATNRPFRGGKSTLYEGGVRAVAFATWPDKIPAGITVSEPLHMVDWYPTLLKLAGGNLEQPLPLDGRDLWPVLTMRAPSPHDEILLNVTPNAGAIRIGNWKLVVRGPLVPDRSPKENGVDPAKAANQRKSTRLERELFRLDEDPTESRNVVMMHPEVSKKLEARLREYAQAAAPVLFNEQPKDFQVPAVWGE